MKIRDLKHLADPNCEKCKGVGRYVEYDEDDMPLYIDCECTKKGE